MISSNNTNEGDQKFLRNIKLGRATLWLLIPIFQVVCILQSYLTDCLSTGLLQIDQLTKKVAMSFA